MGAMTDINSAAQSARENARQNTGQFGQQVHTAPELGITDSRTSLPVIVTARLAKRDPIAYPDSLPAGGKVDAGLEDSGGIYVSIEFADQLDEDGIPIRISLGGDDEYGSGNDWNSIANGEPGFDDDEQNNTALSYLRELHTAIDGDAEAVRWAATEPHLDTFVARATAPAEVDHSDEESIARTVERGKQLVGAFASPTADADEQAADAIADILIYARSQGLDIQDLLARAERYAEED